MGEPSVLFLDQSGSLGGAELCLLDYLRLRKARSEAVLFADGPFLASLRESGVKSVVIPFDPGVNKDSGGVSQLIAGPRLLAVATRVARLARGHDAIYANTQKAAIVGSIASLLARRPLVWHLHDILDAGHFSSANRRVVVALTNRCASAVVANSSATEEAYGRAGGRVGTVVVHNGIHAEPFEAITPDQASEARSGIGAPRGVPLMGVFGRLTPWKGQHVLLNAMERPGMEHVHAAIVGDALFTEDDRRYSEDLKRRASEPPLRGRVHFLGHREEVPLLMRACDIVVHCSSTAEPFGRVIAEGQLAGRPVVASAAGGALEIVQDGETGLLAAPGDADQLATSVGRLLTDSDFAERLAQKGQASAKQRFRMEDRVADLDRVLANLAR